MLEKRNNATSELNLEQNSFLTSLLSNPDNSVWELIFDSLPDMVALIDLNNKVAKANKAMLKKLNIGDDSIIGTRCNKLMHSDSCSVDLCPHMQMLHDNQPHSIQHYEPKFGCYLEITTTPIFDSNNNLLGSLHIARDISAQKEFEMNLTNFNHELQELNKNKDKFFSIVAHDLRSPFQGLLGYTDLILDELDYMKKTEIRDFVDKIQSSAYNTLTLLENLLTWSRLQSGRMLYNPTSFELYKSLKSSLDLLASTIQSKDIMVVNNLKTNCVVYADQQMIHSVLLNLLSNAVKFSYPGGKISIGCNEAVSTENFSNLNGTETAGLIEISIADNGEGISDEEKHKLFNIHNQYTRPGTLNEQGVGLGLILVKEMVEMHGAQLKINSQPGKGSEFSFALPYVLH